MPLPESMHDSPIIGWLVGSVVGTIAGGIVGFAVGGGPGAALGIVLAGLGAAILGAIVGAIVDELGPGRWDWTYAKPSISGVELEASPDPAFKDAPCRITLRFRVVNNLDRARVKVECVVFTEDGMPRGKDFLVTGNATIFDRAETLKTVWNQESDGKRVGAYIRLTARKGGREYHDWSLYHDPTAEILVPVLPQP